MSENEEFKSDQENSSTGTDETAELSHSDLLTGVFTAPAETFEQYRKQPIRTGDYLYPILALVATIILSTNIIFSNPIIADQMKAKQKEGIRKQLEEQVKKGALSRSEADERMSKMDDQLKVMDGISGRVIAGIGILVSTPIMIIIICGFYFFVFRFLFSHDINFRQVIAASSLSGYISVISVALNTVAAMLTDKMTAGVTPLLFVSAEPKTTLYFILSKMDPFTIWAYLVFAIALAKFAKRNTREYMLIVFGTYLIWSALAFFVLSRLPFFGGLAGA